MSDIQFGQYCMFTQVKQDSKWFEWCVFVKGDASILESIDAVEYMLHPTFIDPVRKIADRQRRFALFSAGWGGFIIGIRVFLTDGSIVETSHRLVMEDDNWPKPKRLQSFGDADVRGVYELLFHPKYRWRQMGTLVRETGLTEEKVRANLDQLIEHGAVRKAYFLSVDNKEMWGATANVGTAPDLDVTNQTRHPAI